MKKIIILLCLIPFLGFSQKIKKTNQSNPFNTELKKIRLKAQLNTVDEKVRLRNYITIICSKDISFDVKKMAYDELIKTEPPYFEDLLINKKFDIVNLKALYKTYEEGIDQVAFAKEFAKYSDSINKELILSEHKVKELETELNNADK